MLAAVIAMQIANTRSNLSFFSFIFHFFLSQVPIPRWPKSEYSYTCST